MLYRGNLISKIKTGMALFSTIAIFVILSNEAVGQSRTPLKASRSNPLSTRGRVLPIRSGALNGGSTTTNVQKIIDKYYNGFEVCILGSQYCGELYTNCFDTTNQSSIDLLTASKNTCFTGFFGAENTAVDNPNIEVRDAAFAKLTTNMQALCIEDNNRQQILGGGCKAMLANQSPGYLRYKECVRAACVSMDGGKGNFAGCFGSTQAETFADSLDGCQQMLSTYSSAQTITMKKELMKEIRSLEEKSCNKMMGAYDNLDTENPGGACKIHVGYTRESSMTRKYKYGNNDFYAITAGGDFYKTAPSSFPTYPNGVSNGDVRYFGRFEKALELEVGTSVFCSYSAFGLPQLYSYDSTADTTYGGAITGGNFGAADMQLIMGGVGLIPSVIGFISAKDQEGTAKLAQQTQAIDSAKDVLKPMGASLVGTFTVAGEKGKDLRIGEELKGTCSVQGGMSYQEGDTITIRWQ
jgi:hypothetical protein